MLRSHGGLRYLSLIENLNTTSCAGAKENLMGLLLSILKPLFFWISGSSSRTGASDGPFGGSDIANPPTDDIIEAAVAKFSELKEGQYVLALSCTLLCLDVFIL